MYKLSSMLLNQLGGPYSWYTDIVSIYILGFLLIIYYFCLVYYWLMTVV